MKSKSKRILEAKDLALYKTMLRVLGDYCTNVPFTGVDKLFNMMIEKGAQVMPKDEHALDILRFVLRMKSPAVIVHQLLNLRFSDLPVEVRPITKKGRRHEVASWTRDEIISDRVKDLVDWSGSGKQGAWTDIDGNKVELVDANDEEEGK